MVDKKPYFLKYNKKFNDFRITERSGFIKRVMETHADYQRCKDISLDDLEPKCEKARVFLAELIEKENLL